MAHQCTDCGRAFEDGSTEMLSGCPDCGGTTFQYRPDGVDSPPEIAEEPPEPPDPAVDSSVARTVGNAATAVRDLVGNSQPSPESPEDDSSPARSTPNSHVSESGTQEDSAQASARSEVVSREDLPPASDTTATADPSAPRSGREELSDGDDGESEVADRPDLRTLREELNDQFESIRVLEPGQYELNLMELYDREEYIIALQEDGKYTIQVPERWDDD
jgi:predicted  nucleic acid-binding Zn-ribbon protein